MSLKIFIIAGEASGDRLGAKLMKELKLQSSKKLHFCGIGGNLMEAEDLNSLFPISSISLMGFVEIIPHIFKLRKLISETIQAANIFQPDIVITIDSPGFCFRVIRGITKLKHSKFIHYVSPSVWAYKSTRVKFIAKYYDLLLSILPFETPYYKHFNGLCKYIGHPISEDSWDLKTNNSAVKKLYNIKPNSKILGVMAGSRKSEVNNLLPIFIDSINQYIKSHTDITVIFPAASNELLPLIEQQIPNLNCPTKIIPMFELSEKNRIEIFKSFDAAIVKSGTSSLELTFAKIPMIVAYKMHFLSFLIVKYYFQILNRLKFASLTNIILKKEAIPEYIQKDCNANQISKGLTKLFLPKFIIKQQEDYVKVISLLSNKDNINPSKKAAQFILQSFKNT